MVHELITDWIKNGLSWHILIEPDITPFVIPANQRLQIPVLTPLNFEAPEGILLNYTAFFDNPLCGIDIATKQGLTYGNAITVQNLIAGGLVNQPWYQNARVPPLTPPGLFGVTIASGSSEWQWQGWSRLYVFNVDIVAHFCMGLGYTQAALEVPRPKRVHLEVEK